MAGRVNGLPIDDSTLRPRESQCTPKKDVLSRVRKVSQPPSFLAYPTLSDHNKAGKGYEWETNPGPGYLGP